MYARLPTEKELVGTGLTVADHEEEAEVWPENWPSFSLFQMMRTQWDVGLSGPIGLKYQVLFELMDRMGLSGNEWWEVFADIKAMESDALSTMRGG
ncbi:DUF1799 domain-containing protein [Azonexus sp. IMCC34839]|uniref:DUF1799 domain-containing protein n=1 Tax=Azonexus sp. IMCC34839 TaxID=3133695 RepID=UPI00399961A7